jgi:hypothetical protein
MDLDLSSSNQNSQTMGKPGNPGLAKGGNKFRGHREGIFCRKHLSSQVGALGSCYVNILAS